MATSQQLGKSFNYKTPNQVAANAATLYERAKILHDQGKYEAAASTYIEVTELLEEVYPVARSYDAIGNLMQLAGVCFGKVPNNARINEANLYSTMAAHYKDKTNQAEWRKAWQHAGTVGYEYVMALTNHIAVAAHAIVSSKPEQKLAVAENGAATKPQGNATRNASRVGVRLYVPSDIPSWGSITKARVDRHRPPPSNATPLLLEWANSTIYENRRAAAKSAPQANVPAAVVQAPAPAAALPS